MRKTDIYSYYAFGYDYFCLRFEMEGSSVQGDKKSVVSRLQEFFTKIDELNLQVTKQASTQLRQLYDKLEKYPKDAKVDKALAKELTETINNIDKTLDAELSLRHAFVVTPKRFDLIYLLDSPEKLLGSNVFALLPDICRFDFSNACKCIAYGLPTSAAFHLMRTTEGVLRFYYCSIVKRGRSKDLMWANMLQHLCGRRDAPKKSITDHLDNIRDNFRNPTQHPDARYDIDEAQDLLAVSIDAVNRMVRDLIDRGLIKKPSTS